MILVDTSVLIDFFKGATNESAQKFSSILKKKIPFGINAFIYQEILQGAKSEKEYELLKRYLMDLQFYYPKHPVDSFEKAARIYFDCRKKGITIRSTIDCIIAQTAIEHNLLLLHNDKDFEAMSGVIPSLKFYSDA
jgi:predicted nucleic acid-binding protein